MMATIMVDAGHGGNDIGGTSLGEAEKSINLRYALALTQRLAFAGHRAIPTRVFDQYVTISQRATMANTSRADLFVSIHANASGNSQVAGPWTIHAAVSTAGKAVAEAVQRAIVPALGGNASAVYPDGAGWTGGRTLGVLRRTAMPAILIELGFMTNPGDIRKLEDWQVMRRTADAIAVTIGSLYP